MSEPTTLEVPFSEKDEAKKLGARWNPKTKKWYVPTGIGTEEFSRWIPDLSEEPSITLIAPIYLLKSFEFCWKCGNATNAYCLASEGMVDDYEEMELSMFMHFSNLSNIPDDVQALLKKHAPSYYLDYTKQTNSYYYVNHCGCGAKLGDFFLHNEPEGAFFPIDEKQAKAIEMTTFTSLGDIRADADYGVQEPDLIEEYAKRSTDKEMKPTVINTLQRLMSLKRS